MVLIESAGAVKGREIILALYQAMLCYDSRHFKEVS